MMLLSVCGCARKAKKAKSQKSHTESSLYPEVHLGPQQTSKTEHLSKNGKLLKVLGHFLKNAPSKMFGRAQNEFCVPNFEVSETWGIKTSKGSFTESTMHSKAI